MMFAVTTLTATITSSPGFSPLNLKSPVPSPSTGKRSTVEGPSPELRMTWMRYSAGKSSLINAKPSVVQPPESSVESVQPISRISKSSKQAPLSWMASSVT